MHIQTKLNKQRAKANRIAAIHAQARCALAQKLDVVGQTILAEYNSRMDAHLATLQRTKSIFLQHSPNAGNVLESLQDVHGSLT